MDDEKVYSDGEELKAIMQAEIAELKHMAEQVQVAISSGDDKEALRLLTLIREKSIRGAELAKRLGEIAPES